MRAYDIKIFMLEVMKGVINLKEKHTIIKLKEQGHSNREVARMTGIHRKTVARHWNEHVTQIAAIGEAWDIRDLQEVIVSEPRYDSGSRGPRKYTDKIDELLDVILAGEAARDAG